MATPLRPSLPGLAKVRTPPILLRRQTEMISALGGRVLELFDAASVVSEGGMRDNEGVPFYYGSTSLLFARRSAGGILPDAADADLAFALRHDPHARLLIVRVAHREAWARAGSALGPMRAEVSVEITARGVIVSVDVEAPVPRSRVSGARF
jgi:hypothetical protein